MNEIINLDTISDLHKALPNQNHVKHPLITIIDFTKFEHSFENDIKINVGFYSIMFKNYCLNKMKYGRQNYDFQEGSLFCIAPKQVITLDEPIEKKDNSIGWGIFFHPDLIRGTSLGKNIKNYTFFSYEVNESLHLSEKEKQILNDIVKKIQIELQENIDKHSQTLIVSNLELLLNYCSRYYDRQFITRKNINSDILEKIENILLEYFKSDNLISNGLPTVKFLAEKVFLSPNYLSDLLKKETGKNAQDLIHYYLIEEAKNLLLSTNNSINDLSFSLGFEYPQYFSKLFKLKTGMTPNEFRHNN
ncbi:MAG: helix-turn-helix transcriptional regulator [Candidatus Sericytochromatia bacterium]